MKNTSAARYYNHIDHFYFGVVNKDKCLSPYKEEFKIILKTICFSSFFIEKFHENSRSV